MRCQSEISISIRAFILTSLILQQTWPERWFVLVQNTCRRWEGGWKLSGTRMAQRDWNPARHYRVDTAAHKKDFHENPIDKTWRYLQSSSRVAMVVWGQADVKLFWKYVHNRWWYFQSGSRVDMLVWCWATVCDGVSTSNRHMRLRENTLKECVLQRFGKCVVLKEQRIRRECQTRNSRSGNLEGSVEWHLQDPYHKARCMLEMQVGECSAGSLTYVQCV